MMYTLASEASESIIFMQFFGKGCVLLAQMSMECLDDGF